MTVTLSPVTDLDRVKVAIRAALKASGRTQQDLADSLGLTPKHVSRVLTGTCAGTLAVIEAMAHSVGLVIGAVPQDRSDAEAAFLAASVAVWREIDRLDAEPDGYHPARMSVDLRLAERAAWERYRETLDGDCDQ